MPFPIYPTRTDIRKLSKTPLHALLLTHPTPRTHPPPAAGNPGVQLWGARNGMRYNTLRYHVSDVLLLRFGEALEEPPLPPPLAATATATASGADGDAATAGGREEGGRGTAVAAAPPPEPPRKHTLLLSHDARGLTCVWNVWGNAGLVLDFYGQVRAGRASGSLGGCAAR